MPAGQQLAKSNVAEMPQQSLIKSMAGKYGLEANTFKNTVIKTLFPSDKQNPSNEQVAAFLVVANQYNLNPFIKEIYAFPGKGGGIIPIVSIDGWNTIINRHPQYDGVEFTDELDKNNNIVAVTAKIYRRDRSHPTMVTEYLSECKRGTEPWKQYPARMLRHKALIQAARYAFGFSGLYDPDEAERIAASGEDVPVPVAVISEEQRTALVGIAQEMGVVEKLGEIVNSAGFEMLAHITVDKYQDVKNAILQASPNTGEVIEGEVVDHIEPEILNRPEDVDEPDAPVERSAESRLGDLMTAINDRKEEIGMDKYLEIANGRSASSMDEKQAKAFLAELNKV